MDNNSCDSNNYGKQNLDDNNLHAGSDHDKNDLIHRHIDLCLILNTPAHLLVIL